MGDLLFERQGHKMVPTALVRRMIGPLRQSLEGIGSLLNDAQAFDAGASRRQYVIGLRDYVEIALLAPSVQAVSAEAANVRISTVRLDRGKMEGELASGAIDFAIDMQLPTSEQVLSTRVRSDTMAVVARAGHRVIKDGRIDIDAYLAQRHVLVTSRQRGIDRLRRYRAAPTRVSEAGGGSLPVPLRGLSSGRPVRPSADYVGESCCAHEPAVRQSGSCPSRYRCLPMTPTCIGMPAWTAPREIGGYAS